MPADYRDYHHAVVGFARAVEKAGFGNQRVASGVVPGGEAREAFEADLRENPTQFRCVSGPEPRITQYPGEPPSESNVAGWADTYMLGGLVEAQRRALYERVLASPTAQEALAEGSDPDQAVSWALSLQERHRRASNSN